MSAVAFYRLGMREPGALSSGGCFIIHNRGATIEKALSCLLPKHSSLIDRTVRRASPCDFNSQAKTCLTLLCLTHLSPLAPLRPIQGNTSSNITLLFLMI